MYVLLRYILSVLVLAGLVAQLGCSSEGGGADQSSGAGSFVPIIVGDGTNTNIDPGSDVTLTWDVTEGNSQVYIEISKDGGLTWVVVESNIANEGHYNLTVPPIPGATFRVRVVPTPGGNPIAQTDDFTTAPVKEIKAVSGESIQPSQTTLVEWTHESYQPDTLALKYCEKQSETFCDDPANWVVVNNAVDNSSPSSGTTNSVNFPIPFLPGSTIISRLDGEVNGETITYAQGEQVISSIVAKQITVGSGGNVDPGSTVGMNWTHDPLQPNPLTLYYCVPSQTENCDNPIFDGSNSNWVAINNSVSNAPPESGTTNSLTGIGVPYIPGESIKYVLGALVDDRGYVFAETNGTISVNSDQAQLVGAFQGAGALQIATNPTPVTQAAGSEQYSTITIKARVAPFIAPTIVKGTAANAAPYDKITVKAFVKGTLQ